MSRTKDQWIAQTGGIRAGESDRQFKTRQKKIQALEERLKKCEAGSAEIERVQSELHKLKDMHFDTYDNFHERMK